MNTPEANRTQPPNILVLMCDQMQAQVLDPDHPCRTPNLDRLAARGLRFQRAYGSNAICAPARASLMTGLLPHNHGVVDNFHYLPKDQANLRDEHPHWAQRLVAKGYRTGYFGKWHVSRNEHIEDYGWQVNGLPTCDLYKSYQERIVNKTHEHQEPKHMLGALPGYQNPANNFYYVTNFEAEMQPMGICTQMALDFLKDDAPQSQPWCCFVSFQEPHDAFHAHRDAFEMYDVDNLPLPASVDDDLADRPGLYRKLQRAFADMTPRRKREAAACYYGCISDIDRMHGKLLDYLEQSGQVDNTIVIMLADHGEMLGAHGLFCKNIGAFEEVYNVPMIIAGPGIASGQTTTARVSSRDLCPTILKLTGCEMIDNTDSQSLASVLTDPAAHQGQFTRGFAEYTGGRYNFTQRVTWDGDWKFVFNGFDFDELYNLADDPHEMHNLADDPAQQGQLEHMYRLMWQYIHTTGDSPLMKATYPGLRTALYGPAINEV